MGYNTADCRIGMNAEGQIVSCQIKSSGIMVPVQKGLTALDVQAGNVRLAHVGGQLTLIRDHPVPSRDKAN